jgi:hypothetical protein
MLTQQLLLPGCVPVVVLQWLGSAKQEHRACIVQVGGAVDAGDSPNLGNGFHDAVQVQVVGHRDH